MSKERWLPIKGYEGRYEISDHGRVKSLGWHFISTTGKSCFRKGRILSPCHPHGYPSIFLQDNNRVRRPFKIHRLVAKHFLPAPPPNYKIINHIDGNKANNYVENLEWTNHSGNLRHAYELGTHKPVKHDRLSFQRNKRLINILTNEIYPSLILASETLSIPRTTLDRKIRNGKINHIKFL